MVEADDNIHLVGPRVMRHRLPNGEFEYSIHDVYCSTDGRVVTYTEDALSVRTLALDALESALEAWKNLPGGQFVSGDLGYAYSKEDLEDWIRCLEEPVLDYE
jgi:hypothetical protein